MNTRILIVSILIAAVLTAAGAYLWIHREQEPQNQPQSISSQGTGTGGFAGTGAYGGSR